MKKIIFCITLAITAISLHGQRGEMRVKMKERLKVEKIGFITSELNLTESEAMKFWPVYNDYEDKMEVIREEMHATYIDSEKKDYVNADSKLDNYLKLKERELELDKNYIKKLKTILPAEKILNLLTLDRRFKEELVKKLKQRMRDRD